MTSLKTQLLAGKPDVLEALHDARFSLAADAYKRGVSWPRRVPAFWLINATILANEGAEAEVP